MSDSVTIVGAGQAGLQVAVSLRQGGHEGEIRLIGSEAHLPYQRPPLSKQVLSGEWPPEKCTLRAADFLNTQDITHVGQARVTSLDCGRRSLMLDNGEQINCDHIVLTTGARLNRLGIPGAELQGVHYLRTLDESLELANSLSDSTRLAIIGGGFIGLEVAATARKMSCKVDVVETQDHILQRSALPPVQDFLLARHRNEGVNIHLGQRVDAILGDSCVEGIRLDSDEIIDADLVLIAVGVRPDIGWLDGSGIDCSRGVIVDERCSTNVPGVWAAGDVCELRHTLFGEGLILESVQNAVSQAKLVAANILGQDQTYAEAPWFWSQQFDCRVQMAGLAQDGDSQIIRQGPENSLSVLSLGEDRLHAIQCINAPMDYMSARKLIEKGAQVPMAQLERPDCNLKELL